MNINNAVSIHKNFSKQSIFTSVPILLLFPVVQECLKSTTRRIPGIWHICHSPLVGFKGGDQVDKRFHVSDGLYVRYSVSVAMDSSRYPEGCKRG